MKVIAFLAGLATSTLVLAASHPVDYATREDVRAFVADMAQQGIAPDDLLAAFHHARHLPAVIKAIQPPKDPGIRSWQSYRGRFVEPKRIAAGLRFWHDHQQTLDRVEQDYGVPAEIVVAIIGIETIYGRHTGKFQTFSALATLAFDYPPRADLFRRELSSLLLLAKDEQRNPLSYRGSYAGALGLPQFLPSSVRQWAVDYDGDGRIDLTASASDAIGSVGRFLSAHGWIRGGVISLPVEADPAAADPLVAEGIKPARLAPTLTGLGVRTATALPDQPAALIDLITPDAPTEYRLGFQNFYVITRYNHSSFYAAAVEDLATTLRSARNGAATPAEGS